MSVLVYAVGCCDVVGAMSQYMRYIKANPTSWLQVDKVANKSKVVVVDCASQCGIARVSSVVKVADSRSIQNFGCARSLG